LPTSEPHPEDPGATVELGWRTTPLYVIRCQTISNSPGHQGTQESSEQKKIPDFRRGLSYEPIKLNNHQI
jgi:hypothetical protein